MRSLYLDTARLGQMSPSALEAQLDFVRLTAEEPSSMYFEKFLGEGSHGWPSIYRRRFPALSAWPGIAGLKQRLAQLAGNAEGCRVLLANRSAQLMMLSARLLFRRCRNVLTADLSWYSYRSLLTRVASRTGETVSTVPLREAVLRDGMTTEQLAARVATHFVDAGCDGLFLPAVDNLGVRMPVEKIVTAIRQRCEIRFVVVDGAQAFCHVPNDLCRGSCDLFIAGCHKWLRAYQPMGLAFYAREKTRDYIERTAETMIRGFEIDDPLIRFSRQLETGSTDGYTETVNISPLFSCCGALDDSASKAREQQQILRSRHTNADVISDAAMQTGWEPVRPAAEMQTGILLLQSQRRSIRQAERDVLRATFQERCGMTLTAYDDGLIRLSMPDRPFAGSDVDQIRKSLLAVN